MSRKYFVLITFIVVFFLAVNIVLIEKESAVDRTVLISEPISAKEKTLKKTFRTNGLVEPSSIHHVYIEKDRGVINSILVEEGQHIEEGTPLVEYLDESIQADVAALEQANDELELEKEKLQRDQAVLEEELKEVESLPDISGEEEGDEHVHPSYDQSRPLQYEINNIDYNVKQIELEQTTNQAKIEAMKESSSETIVESELTGIVTKVHGESRADGEPVLSIASSDPLWTVAYVSEEDIHRIEDGQSVLLYPEYLKGNRAYGTVIDVGTYPKDPDNGDGQSMYPVTIEIGEEAVSPDGGPTDEQSADEEPASELESTEPVEDEFKEDINLEDEDSARDEESSEAESVPLRFGAHVNANITLEEMTGLTVHKKAVKYNKAIVLHKGKLKQKRVTIGLLADDQYVLAKGVKDNELLLQEADLTIDTGTSYITMSDFDTLTKKRMQQFSGKEFSLLFLHGLLR